MNVERRIAKKAYSEARKIKTLQRCEASRRCCPSVRSFTLQLLPDLLLNFIKFGYASVNADALALVQFPFSISCTYAFSITGPVCVRVCVSNILAAEMNEAFAYRLTGPFD